MFIEPSVKVHSSQCVYDVYMCVYFTLAHVENEDQYIQSLERFGEACVYRDNTDVASAFLKFAVFTKELTALFKNLVSLSLSLFLSLFSLETLCIALQ